MRFSYWPAPTQRWDQLLDTCHHVERTGWDGIWFADHFIPSFGDVDGPNHECWTILAGLAAAVPRVRLGPLVTGNTYRHPAVLAKMAATVDHISGGRLVLGLGAGWQENEHEAYGIEFGTIPLRLNWLEEACQVITSLFTEERTDFAGARYTITDAPLAPKPVQSPLPLLIGGGGEQRTLRIAARYANEWNIWGTPELLAQKGAVLEKRCAEVDRDPTEISRSAVALLFLSDDEAWLADRRDRDIGRPLIVGTPAEVQEIIARYRDAGVDEVIIPDWNMGNVERRKSVLDQFVEEVAPAFRDQ
jgi:F420-dependent oxidoreductase-like protein